MRVPANPNRNYPLIVRFLFLLQKRKYGTVLYPSQLWGRIPTIFIAVSCLYGTLGRRGSRVDANLRSLMMVRVSQLNDCSFCIDINSANLAQLTGTMLRVKDVSRWRESPLFNTREQCALEYAEAMTLPDQGVDDELSERLHTFFDDDTIVELTALIAYQNMSTKFNNALDVPSQGFCQLES